ncbi:type III-A CRISPR-associated RAMP protein Csm5 [Caldicellulosiruptor acetigenus]|uniref:type III-A CRISPR-associated RAMP protein Csm5 n=1 Tax=Caldicellulosiruptor acetigenus TaxID=301953 RepID=UPI0003FAC732|nr:type III-A CRISPR-associated RAMP protein Csm5 [Caldicellulosiruptor acetigenus]WAM36184.1 type III-A CRISPR-associated RAMP protein Csm5 [Caldicellulosiruptor acetigenus]
MAHEPFESRTYEIEVLTPTIIGGQDKIQSFEFVKDGDYLYFINFDRLLEENLFKESFIDELSRGLSTGGRDFNIKDVLARYNIDFKNSSKYKLKLEGVKRLSKEVVPFVKSAGRFYIPGSSLKGAIRSFVTKALNRNFIQLYENDLSSAYQKTLNSADRRNSVDPKYVSKDAEEKIFATPYESPFKHLKISDSDFVSSENAGVYEIKVMNICGGQVKWFAGRSNEDDPDRAVSIIAEGIKPGAKLIGSIKIEKDFVEGNQVVRGIKEKIGVNATATSPTEFLADVLKAVSKDYIQREINFYTRYKQAQIVSEYQKLLNVLNSLDKNQFLIQIGFSTGYLSKTVGIFFNKNHFEKLAKVDRQSKIYPELFPKTRRLVFKNGQVWTVPGWIKVTIK